MQTGVARKPIKDIEAYKRNLSAGAGSYRIIFAGRVCPHHTGTKAGGLYRRRGRGLHSRSDRLSQCRLWIFEPILLGREARIKQRIEEMGLEGSIDFEIINAKISDQLTKNISNICIKNLTAQGHFATRLPAHGTSGP